MKSNEFLFSVYIQPGAKKTQTCGLYNGHLKVKVNAPPVDGKANENLIAFIAKQFVVPKSRVSIVSGEKNRLKKVKIRNVDDMSEMNKILIGLTKS